MNVLFVCGKNRLRSPTAEIVFADWPGVETASAGTSRDADTPLTAALVDWAELIFVMERRQRSALKTKFRRFLRDKRVVCLDIPDRYELMDPELVALLTARVSRHWPETTRPRMRRGSPVLPEPESSVASGVDLGRNVYESGGEMRGNAVRPGGAATEVGGTCDRGGGPAPHPRASVAIGCAPMAR